MRENMHAFMFVGACGSFFGCRSCCSCCSKVEKQQHENNSTEHFNIYLFKLTKKHRHLIHFVIWVKRNTNMPHTKTLSHSYTKAALYHSFVYFAQIERQGGRKREKNMEASERREYQTYTTLAERKSDRNFDSLKWKNLCTRFFSAFVCVVVVVSTWNIFSRFRPHAVEYRRENRWAFLYTCKFSQPLRRIVCVCVCYFWIAWKEITLCVCERVFA